jgi:hypothetical protein
MSPAFRVALLLTTAAGSGCVGYSSDLPRATLADSAGIRIVAYDLTGVEVPTYREVAEHDLQIGTLDGEPEYVFSRIPSLAVADDGSILVSDGVAQELRVYDARGRYQRTIGRRGEGPGEFASAPTIVALAGDTLIAFDGRSLRLTSFTMTGDLIGETPLRSEAVGRPQSVVRLNDGSYLVRSPWTSPGSETSSYDLRLDIDSVVVTHANAGGGFLDTVRVMAGAPTARSVEVTGSLFRTRQAPTPYGTRAFVLASESGVVLAHNQEFILELVDDDDRILLRVRGVDHPATASEIRSRHEADLREDLGEGEIDPFVLRINLDFLPDRLPAFRSIVVAESDDIWVSLSEFDASAGYDWLVFSPSGELRGAVHTPPDLQVFHVESDHLVGVVFDELEVPYVRRYPLAEPAEADR